MIKIRILYSTYIIEQDCVDRRDALKFMRSMGLVLRNKVVRKHEPMVWEFSLETELDRLAAEDKKARAK